MTDNEYTRQYQAQMRKEIEEAAQDWIRKQKLLDITYGSKSSMPKLRFDDGYVEIGGFRERRSK